MEELTLKHETPAAVVNVPIAIQIDVPRAKRGKRGFVGQQGEQGTNGTDGTNGTNGTNGTDGTNGTNGTNGTDGFVNIAFLTQNITSSADGVLFVASTPDSGVVLLTAYLSNTTIIAAGTMSVGFSWTDVNGARTFTSVPLVLTGAGYISFTLAVATLPGTSITWSTGAVGIVGSPSTVMVLTASLLV